jgi:alpha/beta superfamily hydrolase
MTAAATPRRRVAPLLRRWGGAGRETTLFRLALLVLAVHVVDDNYLQPQRGMSAGDHLASGLVPLALLGLAAWAYPRVRGVWRGALALLFGVLGIAAGIEGAYYTSKVGASGDDFTGLLSLAAGVLLIVVGAVTLWRTRRTDGNRAWRYARRALLGIAGVVGLAMLVLPVGLAYVTTHVGRAVLPDDELGVAHENVAFRTSDGLRLRGWYIPSRNRAAVIAFPGRNGPQKQARMLARHGYGVLLFDRRGEGQSEGEPNAWGWDGDRDVKAAIAFLQRRRDVDPERIGGIGLSVGGEMMLEAASETAALRAVVSEGAGARAFSDEMDHHVGTVERALSAPMYAAKTAAVAVFANQLPPVNLKDVVGRIAPRPLMLIAAPNSPNGEGLNREYYTAAGEPKTLWEIPESKHVGGLEARPRAYERRVATFFKEALLR